MCVIFCNLKVFLLLKETHQIADAHSARRQMLVDPTCKRILLDLFPARVVQQLGAFFRDFRHRFLKKWKMEQEYHATTVWKW